MGLAIRIHDANDGGDSKARVANDANRSTRQYAKANTRASYTHRLGRPPETMGTKLFQSSRSSSPSWASTEYAELAKEFSPATTEPAKNVKILVNASLGDIFRESLQHPAS